MNLCNFCQGTEFFLVESDIHSIYYQYQTHVCVKCGNVAILYNNGNVPIELESTIKRNIEYYQYNICFSCGFPINGESCCKNRIMDNVDPQSKIAFTTVYTNAKSSLKKEGIF
ncbi:MAG: hypothetical protein WD512_13435 [Candidatus Paceibacterota bacterium]